MTGLPLVEQVKLYKLHGERCGKCISGFDCMGQSDVKLLEIDQVGPE